MEHVVLERLDINAIKRDQTIRPHDVDTRGNYAIGARNIGTKAAEVCRSLLQCLEVLGQELDGVLGPVLQKQRDGFFEVRSDVLAL